MPDTPRPRVLLADDDAGICKAITRLLAPSCDVLGPAADSQTLVEMTARTRPHVVLLDFSLPGDMNALEVCRRIKSTMPEVHVVAFTANDDSDLERMAFEVGATGFVWKPRAWTDLLPTIRSVIAGTTPPGGGPV